MARYVPFVTMAMESSYQRLYSNLGLPTGKLFFIPSSLGFPTGAWWNDPFFFFFSLPTFHICKTNKTIPNSRWVWDSNDMLLLSQLWNLMQASVGFFHRFAGIKDDFGQRTWKLVFPICFKLGCLGNRWYQMEFELKVEALIICDWVQIVWKE